MINKIEDLMFLNYYSTGRGDKLNIFVLIIICIYINLVNFYKLK